MLQGMISAQVLAALLCAEALAPAVARSTPSDSTHAPAVEYVFLSARTPSGTSPTPPRFGRSDLAFFALSAGAVVYSLHSDAWLTEETTEANTRGESRLSAWSQPIGNGAYAIPALALAWGAARWSGHPDGARSMLRVGASIGVACGATLGLKEAIGRWRPAESQDNAMRFEPFSGHTSFPSGHATLAFAAASAIDCETSSEWVPRIAYPAATLLAWSRVHDRRHWTSDVVAGAAIGIWTARKTDDWLRARAGVAHHLSVEPSIHDLRMTIHF
jgi:membrane-associated phospholipid phosphatase